MRLANPDSSPVPEIVLEAGRGSTHYWRDLWRYRELAGFLAWRDIKVRYKQAALGVAWAILQPAIQTVLLTFVFGKLARMPDGGLPYALIVLSGLLPWQLFTAAFSGAGNSLVGNSHLISKVYFPRLLVPISCLAVALVDFGVMLSLALPVIFIFGGAPGWQLLLLPLFVLLALVIAFGAGLWITALTVKFRDFRFITPFILQIGMFVTPVGFRTDFLPNWRDLIALNPLAGVVDGVRWCLLGGRTELYLPGLGISVVIAAILLASGIGYFRRTERQFADVI
jgi:lipopolysaccharide transport system permease protein